MHGINPSSNYGNEELKQKLKEAEETYAELDEENGGVMDRSKVEFWRNVSRNIKESDMIEEDKEEFDPVTRMEEIKADNVRLHQKQPRHVDLASREHVNRVRGGEGSKSGLFSSTRREVYYGICSSSIYLLVLRTFDLIFS